MKETRKQDYFKCQQFCCFCPKNEDCRYANSSVQGSNPWSKHPSVLAMNAQEFEGVFQQVCEKGEQAMKTLQEMERRIRWKIAVHKKKDD